MPEKVNNQKCLSQDDISSLIVFNRLDRARMKLMSFFLSKSYEKLIKFIDRMDIIAVKILILIDSIISIILIKDLTWSLV